MTRSLKVVAALRAMKNIGIGEDAVKPVLKDLLKLYDKNWELIEEENYRVLADAVFENQEKLASKKEKRSEVVDPGEDIDVETPISSNPPLKRLRTRRHGSQVSPSKLQEHCPVQPSLNTIVQTPPHPRRSGTEVSEAEREQLHGKIATEPLSPLNLVATERPNTSQSLVSMPPTGLSNEEHACLSRSSLSNRETSNPRRRRVDSELVSHGTCALVVPKDEPFTHTSQVEHPIAVLHREPPQVIEQTGTNCIRKAGEDHVTGTQDSHTKNGREDESRHIHPGCGSVLEIGSSESGDVKVFLNCYRPNEGIDFQMPCFDDVAEMVDNKYMEQYRVSGPSFSLKEIVRYVCECVIKLGTNTHAGEQVSLSPVSATSSISSDSDVHKMKITVAHSCSDQIANMTCSSVAQILKDSSVPYAGPLAVIQQHETVNGNIRLIHDVEDITKGEEDVKISWVNDINVEVPPPFQYISRNLIFQNADVRISLTRITEENCCLSCFGDCVALLTPCACGRKFGGDFAYILGGLLRDGFLDAYISNHRNYQNPNLFYCNECPIEKWRSNDFMEACKGHIMKSFIKECWSKCGCNRNCSNRIVQCGISHNLQVFYTPDGRGWGLRTLDNLAKGSFVCEVVGEILTCKELFARSIGRTGRIEYAVILDADWGSYKSLKTEKALGLDARNYGNISRCLDANLVDIPVEVELPDHHYYHLALFTTRNVDAFEELTWDYGIDFDDIDNDLRGFRCICGSQYCRNIKRPSKTMSEDLGL